MALRISNEKPKSTSDNQKKTFVHLIVISHGNYIVYLKNIIDNRIERFHDCIFADRTDGWT